MIHFRYALCVLFSVLIAIQAWSQTEPSASEVESKSDEKPAAPTEGPHKGSLVTAANYHLELVWDEDVLQVYLLDAEYKNETVQNSEVGIFIQAGNVESEMSCHASENHFECKQNGKKVKKGTLAISSKRNGVQAEEVKVPFELKAPVKKSKEAKKKK